MRRTSEITSFGRRVKVRLLELNMEQSDLARELGTSNVQISRILHGTRPGRQQVPRIARFLGIPLEEEEKAN